ncbi:YgaP family membrane protein [Pseudomonas sp.]|uniref:YgaP family membrane protein n=1 Tax=Pseudomonas sp. TaxID=306 RepID=UPI003FD8027C
MSDIPGSERIDSAPFETQPQQNVQGWERAASLAGGVLMMGKGLRRGGFLGLVQLAVGGAVLARGITGHCAAKSLIEQSRSDMNKARSRIERAGAKLSQLKTNAEVATEAAAVTGNDSLKRSKAGV